MAFVNMAEMPGSADSGEYELNYRTGSFSMREKYYGLEKAIARAGELRITSQAHCFTIAQQNRILMSEAEILRRTSLELSHGMA